MTAVASYLASWAESFIFAGSSAILLLIANLFHDCWYLTLFALAPLLYRIIKSKPKEAAGAGLLFGLAFFGVLFFDNAAGDMLTLGQIVIGIGLITLFAWATAAAREKWGFNPLIVAVLWAVVELILIELGIADGFLVAPVETIPLLSGMAVVFGLVIVSLIVVLINTLIAFAIEKVVSLVKARATLETNGGRFWDLFLKPGLFTSNAYLIPESRAPPASPVATLIIRWL